MLRVIMASDSSQNTSQWPPYPSYMDCSQRLCSIYCPQWCYIMPPPPQFDLTNDDDGHASSLANEFSPLIIAVVGVLATSFLLITYLTFISKHCRRRGGLDRNSVIPEFDDPNLMSFNSAHQRASSGLDEAVIRSIAVTKYKKGDGFVDGTDCSVCLGEFQDDECLKMLPKCSHAFHIPCIDTWLRSHATCPLCRCAIPPVTASPPSDETPPPAPEPEQEPSNSPAHPGHIRHHTVLEVEELEALARQEAQTRSDPNECVLQLQPLPMRRSVSLGSRLCDEHEHRREELAENSARELSSQNQDLLTRSVSAGRAMLLSTCKNGQ